MSNSAALRVLDWDAVQECNIVAMVSPSSTLKESTDGVSLLLNTRPHKPHIRTTVGVHPYHVTDDDLPSLDTTIKTLQDLLLDEKNKSVICAVGECGLDASEGFPVLQEQIPWLERQVQLAQDYQLPLFVHERLAFFQCMEILEGINVPIVIHCFTGTRQECHDYLQRGYFISVSGYICKEVGEEVRACLEEGLLPLERLMIESDAPYMGFPQGRVHFLEKQASRIADLNGKQRKRLQKGLYPNVPSCLPLVLDQVVESLNQGRAARDEPLYDRTEVARVTTENAQRFFGFPQF